MILLRTTLRAATLLAAAALAPLLPAQSSSGFTYNGLNFTSYQANEYLNSNSAATAMRATGANYAAVMVTQYQQTSTSNTIAPETASTPGYNSSMDPLSPTDAAVVSATKSAQAQGLTVSLKPQVDSLDGVFRGNFAPTNPTAWFASYQTFILHYAQIAAQNNVGMLVIGTELKSLSGATYKSNWETIITALRTQYPSLTLVYGANATSAGDEFTSVSFWADVDIIGVDGYFPLTNQADPSLSALVSAWTSNRSGFNIVSALRNLQSAYNKPLIFSEIGYVSVSGTNEQPYANITGPYDTTEQQDCYEAFFEVFSAQSAWMKGVFWWDWTVSAPGSSDLGYSPQNKPAGTVTLPRWFNSATPGFTIAPTSSTVALGQGLTTTDVVAVTPQGGFTGAVTLAASGLPAGVTASFSPGFAAGTQNLTLTAASSAALAGPITVTVTGTSSGLTATTTIALSVVAPLTQTISFPNPGTQRLGATLTLAASSTSGLPIAFTTTTPSVCSVNNTAATAAMLIAGTCSITAAQPGNGTYATAAAVTDSFTVAALAPVPVPATAQVIVSQVNWRALLGGYAFASGNAAGSSFAVNSSGMVAIANSNNVVLFNAQTGATTNLGAWSSASALAIDSHNNIFVGNPYGPVSSIVKIPYVGGSANGGYAPFTTPTTSTPVCTSNATTECLLPTNLGAVNPASMAFDAGDNLVYATSVGANTVGNSIFLCNVACVAGTGAPVLLYTEPTASPAPSSASGQLLVGGLSLDSAGNLFFTDSSIYVNTATYAYTSFTSNLNELPTTTGTGFAGHTTGFAASPIVLETLTPASPSPFGNQIGAVAVQRNPAGDTVFFATQNDGIFAFPDSSGGIPTANGKPTALYTAAIQGAKTLALDTQGNLYLAAYSSALGSGGDTLAQVTLGAVSVPASPVGTPVSPSTTSPITTVLNDTACGATPTPSLTFSGNSSTATATATAGSCAATFSGGASFPTTIAFTPTIAGPASITLNVADQAANTGTVIVSGTGSGFTLSPVSATVTVPQTTSVTDTISITDFGGFSGSVTLSASGLPTGVTATFAPNPATSSTVLTLTASSAAAIAGPVTITITGTSGALTTTATIALTISSPASYQIAPALGAIALTQGGSNTDTIAITPTNGFSGPINFTATGLPTGVTAAFSPNPTTTGSTVLTLSASTAATAGGPVNVTITATSGALTQSATVAVTVNVAPGFTLAPSPAAVSLAPASTAATTLTITPAGGFTGAVTLAATGLPTGVTAAFATNPATSTSVVTFTAAASATLGVATVTLTGTSGNLTAATTIALTTALPPSFTVAPAAATLSLVQGNAASDVLTITPANGFTGPVTFTAAGLPTGVTAAFATNPATAATTLQLTASATATPGAATLTVTGTSGALTSATSISLTVLPPPGFTLIAAPAALTLAQTASATSTVTITSTGGFTGTPALTITGLPTGVTATFARGTVTGTQILTLTASATATIGGPVTLTIAGASGTLKAATTLALTVVLTPGFTLTGNPIVVQHGTSILNTSVISIQPTNGFAGAVALTCAITPMAASNPPTCTLSPTSVTLSGNTPQSSTLTVNTTAGALVHNRATPAFWTAGGGVTLALMLFLGLPRKRRTWRSGLLALSFAIVSLGISGCAASTSYSAPAPGTPPGSYTVTLTGTSGATTSTGVVSLTVQ